MRLPQIKCSQIALIFTDDFLKKSVFISEIGEINMRTNRVLHIICTGMDQCLQPARNCKSKGQLPDTGLLR